MRFKDKNIAVVGFGVEGKDAINFLLAKGAHVTLLDQKNEKEFDFSGVEKSKFTLVLGPKYLSNLEKYDLIVRSAGVYPHKEEFDNYRSQGGEIVSAISIFFDLCPAKIIGVTGTKGKGTTSTLIYEALKSSGKDVYLAGNIGYPFLELLPKLKRNSLVILELSSFQLLDIQKSPDISVVLNITTDHMDWHKDRKEYLDAKKNIVKFQSKNDFAVINADYKDSLSFAKLGKGKKYYFSRRKKVEGSYVRGGKIILNLQGKEKEILNTNDLQLRGEHNWENVTAACCASSLAGASISAISKTLREFRGLVHRLEFVGKVNDISFYNDSFATGPDPTIAAIKSFSEPITLILGGHDKGLDYNELVKVINENNTVKNILLIGDLAKDLERLLKPDNSKVHINNLNYPKMKEIVSKAIEVTPKGGVVLLSPAAASFDMFVSYKDRGDQFRAAVERLQ